MTGYACVEKPLDKGFNLRVEIKSLNHRYSDIKVKLPREFAQNEITLKQKIQALLPRGSVDLRIEFLQEAQSLGLDFEINKPYLEKLISEVSEISRNSGRTQNHQVENFLSLPGVLIKKQPSLFKDQENGDFLKYIDPLLQEALSELNKMKTKEGLALFETLYANTLNLQSLVSQIKKFRVKSQDKWKEKISKKITLIFDAYPIENTSTQSILESKISQELAYMLEKTDVEEEIKRLEIHCEAITQLLLQGSPIGRKFEFLTQELHREMNTLGNKAHDSDVSELALQGKILIDQMKEQSLNIE